MKKQFSLFFICLILTATSVSANSTKNLSSTKSFQQTSKTQAQIKCDLEKLHEKQRASMYNELKLSESQRTKAEAFYTTANAEYQKYLEIAAKESQKLWKLETNHANASDISKQKLVVEKARAEARAHHVIDKSNELLKTILTKEQKAKFDLMQKEIKKRWVKGDG